MNIGEKIKQARQKKGYSQTELGNIIGVQKAAISKYEKNQVVNIKRSTLKKLADALDLRISELVFESNQEYAATLHARIINDDLLVDMIENYYKLNSEQQKIVRDVIKNMLKDN